MNIKSESETERSLKQGNIYQICEISLTHKFCLIMTVLKLRDEVYFRRVYESF